VLGSIAGVKNHEISRDRHKTRNQRIENRRILTSCIFTFSRENLCNLVVIKGAKQMQFYNK
jgi:hypothetical protein